MLKTYKVLRAMLDLKEFTVNSLAQFSGVNAATVRSVIRRRENILEHIGFEEAGQRGGRFKIYRIPQNKAQLISSELKGVVDQVQSLPSVGDRDVSSSPRLLSLLVAEDRLLNLYPKAKDLEEKRQLLQAATLNIKAGGMELEALGRQNVSADARDLENAKSLLRRVEGLKMLSEAELAHEEGSLVNSDLQKIADYLQELRENEESERHQLLRQRLSNSPIAHLIPPSSEAASVLAAQAALDQRPADMNLHFDRPLPSYDAYSYPLYGSSITDSRRATLAYLKEELSIAAGYHRVAVLPFSSPDRSRHICDGIANVITNALSRIPNLVVMSPTPPPTCRTIAADAETAERVQNVGRELGVSKVLVGSLAQKGSNLTCETALVDVAEGSRIVYGPYKGRLANILTIENRILKKVLNDVTKGFQIDLPDRVKEQLAQPPTNDSMAHFFYLSGHYYWKLWTAEGIKKAIYYFTKALVRDSSYALAYVGLADCYNMLTYEINVPPDECFPKATENAYKALKINRNLAEAYTSLAYSRFRYDRMWPEAESLYQLSIELNPNYIVARQWYAESLAAMGQFYEAKLQMDEALKLDPHSLITNVTQGSIYFFMREYEKAIEQFQKILHIDEGYIRARFRLGGAYVQAGKYDEAIRELRRVETVCQDSSRTSAVLGYAYAVSGSHDEARIVLKRLLDQNYVSPYSIALIYVGLGQKEEALKWLRKANEGCDPWMVFLNVDPRFDCLRSETDFKDLIASLPSSQVISYAIHDLSKWLDREAEVVSFRVDQEGTADIPLNEAVPRVKY